MHILKHRPVVEKCYAKLEGHSFIITQVIVYNAKLGYGPPVT
jgi:hypothetical protein